MLDLSAENLFTRAGHYTVEWTRGQTSINFNLYLCKLQPPSTVRLNLYIDLDEGHSQMTEPIYQQIFEPNTGQCGTISY